MTDKIKSQLMPEQQIIEYKSIWNKGQKKNMKKIQGSPQPLNQLDKKISFRFTPQGSCIATER